MSEELKPGCHICMYAEIIKGTVDTRPEYLCKGRRGRRPADYYCPQYKKDTRPEPEPGIAIGGFDPSSLHKPTFARPEPEPTEWTKLIRDYIEDFIYAEKHGTARVHNPRPLVRDIIHCCDVIDRLEAENKAKDEKHIEDQAALKFMNEKWCKQVDRIAALRGDLELKAKRIAELEGAFGIGETWPLLACLKRLINAAEHLFEDHACDRHGYEADGYAMIWARGYVKQISEALNKNPKPKG